MLPMKRAWVSETKPRIFPGVMCFWENNKQDMAGGCVRSGTSHSWLQQIKGSVPSLASLSMWWLWPSSALARPSRALKHLPHKWRLVEMIWPPLILQVAATTQQCGAEPGLAPCRADGPHGRSDAASEACCREGLRSSLFHSLLLENTLFLPPQQEKENKSKCCRKGSGTC